jgi:hypothetical protein
MKSDPGTIPVVITPESAQIVRQTLLPPDPLILSQSSDMEFGPAYPELTPGSQDEPTHDFERAHAVDLRGQEIPQPLPPGSYIVTREQLVGLWHDPVDMIKIEPPSEAEQELAIVSEWLNQAFEELDKPITGQSSWKVEHHSQRAQAQAQIAQAQASYAIALQLRQLNELLEEALPAISQHIDQIGNELEFVASRIPS